MSENIVWTPQALAQLMSRLSQIEQRLPKAASQIPLVVARRGVLLQNVSDYSVQASVRILGPLVDATGQPRPDASGYVVTLSGEIQSGVWEMTGPGGTQQASASIGATALRDKLLTILGLTHDPDDPPVEVVAGYGRWWVTVWVTHAVWTVTTGTLTGPGGTITIHKEQVPWGFAPGETTARCGQVLAGEIVHSGSHVRVERLDAHQVFTVIDGCRHIQIAGANLPGDLPGDL